MESAVAITEPFIKAYAKLDRGLRSKVERLLETLGKTALDGDWRLPGAVPIDVDGFEVSLSEEWIFEYRMIYEGHVVRRLKRIDVNLSQPRTPLDLRI
jgi:hypothetical protein